MKRLCRLFILLLLCTLVLYGCISGESQAKKTAEGFTRRIYTVDSASVSTFVNAISADSIVSMSEKINSLHNDFVPLVTKEGYEDLIINRLYLVNLQYCMKNNCTMQPKKIVLTRSFYDEKENKLGFSCTVSVDFISNKDNSVKTDIGEENVGLTKENGQWKVYGVDSVAVPKLIIN